MGSFWNLPEEITFDILSRLPAKSVGMCRCVSKPWRALLFQTQFIKAHLHRSINTHQLSLTLRDPERYCSCYLSLSDAHQVFDKITLSQIKPIVAGDGISGFMDYCSCDGLLFASMGHHLFVLNPITREIIQLPEAANPFHFPALNWYTRKTFGYDTVDDDYKVIVISLYVAVEDVDGNEIMPHDHDEMLVDVYSLKRGCWKRAQTSIYYDSYIDMEGFPVLLHGCLIWIAKRTADQKYAIVGFSLVEEKFFEVPPPPHSVGYFHCLCVLDGCLCIFGRNASVDLWMMKEYGVKESWIKFIINHADAGMVGGMFSFGEENIVIRYVGFDTSVMYNLKEGSFKYFEFAGSARHFRMRNSFVESLVSPCGW